MTIYFMGGEMSSFVPSDSTALESTFAQGFNSSFARCSVHSGSSAGYAESAEFAAPDECYYHLDFGRATTNSTTGSLLVLVAGSTEVFRIRSSSTTLQMQAWIAAAWTNVGAAVSYSGDAGILNTADLYIDGNSATGTAKLYLSGTLRETAASVDLSAVTGVTKLRSYAINSASGFYLSQVVVTDVPTIGGKLGTRYVNAAGASSDFTGGYTDIDEIVYSDADFINSATNGHVSTFGQTGPALTGYTVQAVGVYARAKCGASGPENLQLALRSAGTTYFSGSKLLDVGYTANGHIWETNPATGVAFLASQIDALQPGAKAVT